MPNDSHSRNVHATIARVVVVGIVGLAAAMGIGRFAFTPLLPLMQARRACCASRLAAGSPPRTTPATSPARSRASCSRRDRGSRYAAASSPSRSSTAGDGLGARARALARAALRRRRGERPRPRRPVALGAGAARARTGQAQAAGGVYAGVGIGIALAGLAGLEAALHARPAAELWLLLGVAAAAAAVVVWSSVATTPGAVRAAAAQRTRRRHALAAPVFAYGAFGFGYIIPATFLPAIAREQFADPHVFGWIWPAFGLAAALSTIVAARWLRHVPPRRIWIGCQLVMALGVAAPALALDLAHLLFSAVCIGGTFMVMTMAAMQEAQRIAAQGAGRTDGGDDRGVRARPAGRSADRERCDLVGRQPARAAQPGSPPPSWSPAPAPCAYRRTGRFVTPHSEGCTP